MKNKVPFDHPIYEILSLFASPITIDSQNQLLQDFYSSWNLPILTKQEIQEVTDYLRKNPAKSEQIASIEKKFSFSESQLSTFLNFFAQDQEMLNKTYPIVIANGVKYLLENRNIAELPIMLKSLFSLSKTNVEKLADYLFFFILEHTIKTSEEPFTKEMFDLIFPHLTCKGLLEQISFSVICLFAERLYKQNDVENASKVLEIISKSVNLLVSHRLTFDDTIICRIISNRLHLWEQNIYQCLSFLAGKKESESIKGVFAVFVNVFMNKINKESAQFVLPKENKVIPGTTFKETPTFESLEFPHTLQGQSLFEAKIPGTDSTKTEESFFPESIKNIMELVGKVFEKTRSLYADLFFTAMAPVFIDNKLNMCAYIAFIYLLRKTPNTQNFSHFIFDAVLNETIFNPEITIFSPPEEFDDLACIRQLAVDSISNKLPQYLPQVLTNHVDNPFLFAELCMRIQGLIGTGVVFEENVFKSLISVENKFRKIYEDNEDYREVTITARSAIFVFIFAVLNNPNATVTCFSSKSFISSFLTAFFEPSFTDIVFAKLRQVFQTVNSAAGQTADFVASALKILRISSDANKTSTIASKMISCIVDSIPMNPSVVKYCGGILRNAIEYTEAFTSTELFTQILQLALQMFLHNNDFDFDEVTIQKISTIIRATEGHDVTESTRTKLLCFLAASQSVNANFLSLIRKPSVLTLIFSIYTAGGLFKELFQLMMDLCNYSCFNCIMLHKGEVDLLLCEIIANFPNSFTFRGCQIDNFVSGEECLQQVMPLLSRIMSYKSTPLVAERIMKIIAPQGDNFLPLSKDFFARLIPAMRSLVTISPISYPLGIDKKYYSMQGISAQELFSESTLTFWLKADPVLANQLNVKASIVRGFVNGKTLFELYLRQMTLYCEIQLPDRVNSFHMMELPDSNWNCVCIVFRRGPASKKANAPIQLKITSRLNKCQPQSSSLKETLDYPEPMVFDFGNNISTNGIENEKLICVYQIAKFSIYEKVLDNPTSENLVISGVGGPHLNLKVLSTIFGNVEQKYPFKEEFSDSEVHKMMPNILNVFHDYISPESFVPVFSYLKNAPPNYANLLVDFMANCFGEKIKIIFDQIPYFLSKSPKEVLTFQLYQMFYGLMELFSKDEDISLLLRNLLINGELWGRAPAKALQKICSHWSTALIDPLKENNLLTDDFFAQFLMIYRRYFWIERSEKKINGPDNRDPNLDMSMVLYCLDRFISEISQIKLNENIVEKYFLNCIFCEDNKLTERLLGLVPMMLQILQTPSIDLANMMHFISVGAHPDFIFLMLYTYQLLFPSLLYQQTILFGFHVPPTITFKDITSSEGELDPCSAFPIILILGLKSGFEIQVAIIQRYDILSKNPETCEKIISHQCWYVWFIMFILQIDPTLHLQMVDVFSAFLLYKFNTEEIETVFGLMDILRVTTKFPVNKIKALITKALCAAKENDRESLPHLINFCFSSLFMRFQRTYQCEQLINIGVESEFSADWIHSQNTKRNEKLLSFNQFRPALAMPKGSCNYRLHLSDWDNMPASQQLLVGILRNLLDKTPLFTPILHVIQLISRYPKGGSNKKMLILKIVSDREFLVLQNLFAEKLRNLEQISIQTSTFFEIQDQTLLAINSRYSSLSDPAIKIIADLNKEQAMVEEKIRKNIPKYMDQDSIWGKRINFKWEKSSIALPNYDCVMMKKVVDIPKHILKINSEPSTTAKVFPAHSVTIRGEKDAKFAVEKKSLMIYFETKIVTIKVGDIKAILQRRRRQLPTAIEVYLHSGKSYLLDFFPQKCAPVIAAIKEMKVQTNQFIFQTESSQQLVKELDIVGKWNSGELTNYEFLLLLNIYSGRSFNDIHNYPVFPWTKIDFSSTPNQDRDFAFPLAAQTQEKQAHFREQVKTFSKSSEQSMKFIYGAGISAPVYLSSFLMRIQPFTDLFEKLHESKISKNDLIFQNIHRFFEQVEKTDENRELVPEAFTLPEAFIGDEATKSDVPKFAVDPFEWIYINKKNINAKGMAPKIAQWVDLVFGYAQTGAEAEKHLNVFIPYIYSDVWDRFKETASMQQSMIFDLTMNLGSIPQPIFNEPLVYSPTSQTSDLEMSCMLQAKEQPAVSADFYFIDEQKQSIFIMTNKGSMVQYTANFLAGTLTKVPGKSIIISAGASLVCSNSAAFAISKLTGNVIVVTNDKISKAEIGERNIKIVCQDQDSILTASVNGIITIRSDNALESPTTKISAFSDTLTAICFSNFFKVVVVATADGRLSLYSKRTGLLIKQQELPDITKAVLVTNGYGLILASTAHNIYVLTNNGSITKVVPFDREINKWCTWEDQNGVDFVCSSDANGNILIFEAFYPDKILFSASCGARILSIKYDNRLMGVVAITTVPDVHFYPFS